MAGPFFQGGQTQTQVGELVTVEWVKAGGNALMADAKTNGWAVISMKNDWKQIFSFESQ
jgi:hypothetical protein